MHDHVRQMSASYPARFPVYPRLPSKPVRLTVQMQPANIFIAKGIVRGARYFAKSLADVATTIDLRLALLQNSFITVSKCDVIYVAIVTTQSD